MDSNISMREECRNRIISNDYVDIITNLGDYRNELLTEGGDACLQYLTENFLVIYSRRSEVTDYSITKYGYRAIKYT